MSNLEKLIIYYSLEFIIMCLHFYFNSFRQLREINIFFFSYHMWPNYALCVKAGYIINTCCMLLSHSAGSFFSTAQNLVIQKVFVIIRFYTNVL